MKKIKLTTNREDEKQKEKKVLHGREAVINTGEDNTHFISAVQYYSSPQNDQSTAQVSQR